MKNIFLIVLIFFLNLSAWAQDEVTIGCAYTCDSDIISSLKQSAKRLKIKIKILNLSVKKEVHWKELQGILIPGGEDIDPHYYVQHVEPELAMHIRSLDHLVEYSKEGQERDEFEYNLLQEYYRDSSLTNFPMLGICRGMQMMTVALGIPLYVDIKTELLIENRRDVYDQVQIKDQQSILAGLFPSMNFLGYKYHHQGLRLPYYQEHKARWPNVKVTAISNDGKIAEGIELLDRPALGVQFHPEADNSNVRKAVFDWFVQKARDRNAIH